MTTADDVLNEARRWLGTTEQPVGSNNVPGVTDRPGFYDSAWCDMFVSTVLENAGIDLPGSGFSWVSSHFEWAKKQPGWLVFNDWTQAQPGDLIGWEWGNTAGGLDHISLVESVGPFTTIGGNERDAVRRQIFSGRPNGAVIFARPPYEVPVIPDVPQQVPIPPEDDMAGKWHRWVHEAQGAQYAVLEQGGCLVGKVYLSHPDYAAVYVNGQLGPFDGSDDFQNNGGRLDSLPWLGAAPAWADLSEEQLLAEVKALPEATVAALKEAL